MSSSYPQISVHGIIKLGQFLKLSALVQDGAEARRLIQDGYVLVNGQVETRRGHGLSHGDTVEIDTVHGMQGAVVATADW